MKKNLVKEILEAQSSKLKARRGFSTTELLVGIGIFTVIGSVMTGIFVSALRNQRLIQQIMVVNNNGGLVLEQIAREARTGYTFIVEEGEGICSEGSGSRVTFVNGQGNVTTTFALAGNETVVRQAWEGGEPGPELELSASSVAVKRLCFFTKQFESERNFCNPERLTILMEVAPLTNASSVQPLHLQTTVSSRVLPREIPGDPYECRL